MAGRLAAEQRRDLVVGQLQQILSSKTFSRSARRRAILEYVVGLALDDRTSDITGAGIAAAIYGREDGFHADQDAIVRVEMGRLRASLEAFYSAEGWNSAVRIVIPKGSYVPSFEVAERQAPAPAEVPPEPVSRSWHLSIALSAAAVLALAVLFFVRTQHRGPEPPRVVFRIPGRQRRPSASPDGKMIAFVRDGEAGHDEIYAGTIAGDRIWTVTAGELPANSPEWAPDGRRIAFLRRTGPATQDVCVVDALPNGSPRTPSCPASIHTAVNGVAWAPDSKSLFIPDSPPGRPLAIHHVTVASGERHAITAERNFFAPSISPDGRTLLWLCDAEPGLKSAVYTMPLSDRFEPAGEPRRLDATLAPDIHRPRWSADGQSILYSTPEGIKRYRLASQTVEKAGEFPEGGTGTPDEFTPGRFLLVRFERQSYLAAISGAAGEKPAPLFDSLEQDTGPEASPDGRRLAFLSRRGGKERIWIALLDSNLHARNAVELDTPDSPAGPRWSPDSSRIVFHAQDSNGHRRIYIASPGGRAHWVETGDGIAINPFFSRDGRSIYFASDRGNAGLHIWNLPLSGKVAHRVTEQMASIADESADGRFLYFSSTGGVWRMPVSGGRAELVAEETIPGPLRAAPDGLYYESHLASGGVAIRGPAGTFALPGIISGWSPAPGVGKLLVSAIRNDSKVEIFTLR